MRVLHLTLSFAAGGRRQAITTLLQQSQRQGPDCDLCCLDTLGCRPEELSGLVGAVEVLERRPHRATTDRKALHGLVDLCMRRQVDVIHAHDAASHLYGAVVRLNLPVIRLLMTFHRTRNFESATLRSRVRNAFAIALSDFIVTGSRERREHFLRSNFVKPGKVIRIPFGIDTNRFIPDAADRATLRQELGISPETIVFGAVGHFGPEKGIDLVVRAFATLARAKLPAPVALLIVGGGTAEQDRAMRSLATGDLPGPVVYAAFRNDVERWFRCFDIFVHAPRQEAFGLVLAEAMATGLPIIASQVGGILDIVQNGRNGWLVPPQSPGLLADAMSRLAADGELRRAMASRSRELALECYSAELYARNYLRVYETMLGRAQALEPADPPAPTVDQVEVLASPR